MANIFGRRTRHISHSSDKVGNVNKPPYNTNEGFKGSNASLASDASIARGEEGELEKNFHNCARVGDVQGILLIIKRKRKAIKKINKLDTDGLAPLHYAARFNHLDCVKFLVEECNADVLVRDESDQATPLHYAAKKKEIGDSRAAEKIIKYLAQKIKEKPSNYGEKNMDVNVADKYQSTALHLSAMRGNDVVTKALLECEDINVNANDHCQATPLHEAVIYNHVSVVKMLLENKADVLDNDEENSTVLHLAAMEGNLEIVKLLIKHVPNGKEKELIDSKDNTGNLALHLAVENKNTSVVKYLLQDAYCSMDMVNSYCRVGTSNSTPLHLAAVGGDEDLVQMLLDKGAIVTKEDGDGMTPLHRSVEYDHLEVTKMLLDEHKGHDRTLLECRDIDGFTPLLVACCNDSTEVMKELLRRKANIHALDNQENTCLRLATRYNNVAGTKVLLKYMRKINDLASVNSPEIMGNAALHLACRMGRAEIVELLMDNEAEWHCKNEEEETPFHLAAMNGHTAVCKILLDKTDNKVLNDEDEDSNTALHLASKNGHLDVVKVLTAAGADKEARNMNMWTPLDFSASEGHTDLVRFLLEEDVPVNPADKEGTTPLHLGCKNGHLDTVKLLLEKGASVAEKDKEGNNALDIAINNHHSDVAAAIIDSPMWNVALRNYTERGKHRIRDTPMRKLIRKMPKVAQQVLDKCVTLGPEGVSPEHEDAFIQFDYEIVDDNFSKWEQEAVTEGSQADDSVYNKKGLLSKDAEPYTHSTSELKNNSIIWAMVRHNTADLLFHPLILGLIRNKWNLASVFYYIFILYYSVFLALLSAYTAVAVPPFEVNMTLCENTTAVSVQSNFEKVATICLYFLCCVGMSIELFQIWAIRFKYLEPNNLLDWFTYISTIFIISPFSNCGARMVWQWELAAFTVFIAWLDMLLFLRRLPRAGLYVVMIAEIFKTFMRFFVIFFLFIVAFAFSFNILLRNQAPFSNIFYAIMKMWVMMIGEFDFDNIFHPADFSAPDAIKYEAMTYVIFVAFLILMAIIVMNLLTGLAVDDVNVLQANAMVKKVTMQMELALDVEVALPYWIQRRVWFVMKGQRLQPNVEGNIILKHVRRILEGGFLSKETIMEKVIEMAGEDDTEKEKKKFQQKVLKKIKAQKEDMVGIKEQMTRMEDLLHQLVAKKEKKVSRRASQMSQVLEGDDI